MTAQRPTLTDKAASGRRCVARTGAGDCALIDGEILRRLLALALPAGQAALLAQIRADLADVAQGLERARDRRDPAALRAASHVLVSLSGTVGADRPCRAARALTGSDMAAEWPMLDAMAAGLLDDIATLDQELSAVVAEIGP